MVNTHSKEKEMNKCRTGFTMATVLLSACSSNELPVEITLPDHEGHEYTSEEHHELNAPFAGYSFNMSRETLWAEYPLVLSHAGWTAIPDGAPPRYLAAARDGHKVAIMIEGALADNGKTSEIQYQFGDPELSLLSRACLTLADCCTQIKEYADLDDDSETSKSIDRACMSATLESPAGCRTMLAINRTNIRGIDVDPEDVPACYKIPIDTNVLVRLNEAINQKAPE